MFYCNFYVIHKSSEWGCVSMVYSSGVGPMGLAMVRFHVFKKKKKIHCNLICFLWSLY